MAIKSYKLLEHPYSELGQSAGKQLIKLVESSETKGKTCVFFLFVSCLGCWA